MLVRWWPQRIEYHHQSDFDSRIYECLVLGILFQLYLNIEHKQRPNCFQCTEIENQTNVNLIRNQKLTVNLLYQQFFGVKQIRCDSHWVHL